MNYRFVFLGGQVRRALFNGVIRHLRREQALHVVWPGAHLPPGWIAPGKSVRRFEYRTRRSKAANLAAVRRQACSGTVRRIDATLLDRCAWRDEVVRAAGSAAEFLRHGLGFCLLLDDQIISEAYACFWGRERLEIATVTHPDHRGRGCATTTCAHLIDACESLGFTTYWSCDADNAPSRLLAERLGFADRHAYRLLLYERAA